MTTNQATPAHKETRLSASPRCPWCGTDPLYTAYHDHEWGVPVHDDQVWFEFLILEGAQAGLSWITILRKRENYRQAFDGFDVQKVARYSPARVEKLMQNEGIVRNRLKIESSITNAKAFIAVQKEFGSFDAYMWQFVDGQPVINRPRSLKDVPAKTELSDRISKDMKKRGFKFVGSTIIYAHMQATGIVNDHLVDCPQHPDNRPQKSRQRKSTKTAADIAVKSAATSSVKSAKPASKTPSSTSAKRKPA